MAKTLYLFNGITPNIKGHPYFNIKDFANYLSYLLANYNHEIISDDNYRINTNIVKITTANLTNKLFTYAIETDGNGWHRCYFIDMITEQSNMLYLSLSIDYWGSYYLASNIDFLHITRSNRNFGYGIYDDIKVTSNYLRFYEEYYGGEEWGDFKHLYPLNSICLVISLSYNAIENLAGSDVVSTQNLYAIQLSTLKELYKYNDGTDVEPIFKYCGNIEQIISDFLGGIFGIAGNLPDWLANLDAKAVKAYLIPLNQLRFINGDTINVKSKTIIGYDKLSEEVVEATVFALESGRTQNTITIEDFNPDYDYIVGTTGNKGLKLTRYVTLENEIKVDYVFDFKRTDLSIYVRQGENETDITSNFEIAIVGSASTATTIGKIGQVLSTELGFITGAFKAYAKSGALGAGLSIGKNVADLLTSGGATLQSNLIGNSNAIHTYGLDYLGAGYENYLLSPFCVNKYASICDEDERVRVYGAQYNIMFDDINDVFIYDFLGRGTYDLTLIIADDIRINNLPTTARNEIETAFINGVELIDYEGTEEDE